MCIRSRGLLRGDHGLEHIRITLLYCLCNNVRSDESSTNECVTVHNIIDYIHSYLVLQHGDDELPHFRFRFIQKSVLNVHIKKAEEVHCYDHR